MDTQRSSTNNIKNINWRAWDEIEKLTGQTKRLVMKMSVTDQDSETYKKLSEQHRISFLRMADLLVILAAQ